ncbi:hypothetical protein HWD99_16845 [Microbacterium sp. C5A9]|uniref:hypothetical protein n=1 Tax=Microbacterium sp. C5A9 TaxID=2736663 RepID=UPI001F520C59|nr:hypothetical protein [Microbacterium sp. C5A9]MCI1020296.1 hypothetical protein [Microbacterium sp. C5A9]
MSRRTAWTVGSVAAALVLAGAVLWVWQASSEHPSPDDPVSTAASASPTASRDPQELAQQRLDDALEECTSEEIVGGAVPEGCGIRIPWGTEFADVDGIRFRIERMPVLELTDDGFVADGGVLVATVTGTGQDGAARTETYRTESWSVRGDATITGDRVDLDIW